MPAPRPNLRSRPLLAGFAVVAVAGSLVATALTFSLLRRDEERRLQASFQQRAAERAFVLQRSLERQVDLLQAVVALQAASEEVTREEFEAFATPLLLQRAEVLAIEWIPPVPSGERDAFEEAIAGEDWPGFSLTERDETGRLVRAADRPVHYPVQFVEPFVSNARAFGFDLASDPARAATLARARDTGLPAASGPLELVQEVDEEVGLLFAMPHYVGSPPPRTTEERRERLAGFALGVFRAQDLERDAFEAFDPTRAHVFLLQGDEDGRDVLLATWPPGVASSPFDPEALRASAPRGLVSQRRFELGGHEWTVVAAATGTFVGSHATWTPWIALAGGLGLAGLIGAYVLTLLRQQRRLEEVALRDPLTGVLNRHGLELEIERLVARGRSRPAAALLVNFDDFRALNATYGHGVGDVVLVELSQRLIDGVGGRGVVGRVGGDEFLVLLPSTLPAEAMSVAEKLRLRLASQPVLAVPTAVTVTASFGGAEVSERHGTVIQLLAQARGALRESKQAGKNRASLAGGDPARAPLSGRDDALQRACRGEGLRVHWEPVVRLSDETVVGHELLVRGPAGELEAPQELFRLATASDLLTTLDVQCLRACVAAAAAATERGGDVHFNVLPSTLLNVPVDAITRELLPLGTRYRVCLEINEQQLLGHPSHLVDIVRALRDAGVRIAVDDVGSGLGTLDSVFVLQPDVVKIDLSLVRGVSTDAGKGRQLRRLVQVCKSLGIEMIAEGVETAADRDLLRALEISHAQGYLWPVRARSAAS
jgi:diguanylate cyclase (GGDEF)-like protein